MTGRPQQTIRTTGVIDGEGDSDFLIAPDGRTVYVANQFRGVTVIPVAMTAGWGFDVRVN